MTDFETHPVGTAIEQSELYKAAKRDAEEAEAYAEELEAKLEKAVDGLRQCEAEIDDYIQHEYPGDHPVHARYRARDFDANPARTTLAQLKETK